ncbi:uncharacterized protein LOC106168034 [Lingula anatina]|uniref:Uncharacterized protein LOC106168034 n=1 Tax=Lingula anatina TaxID=7574 RepID=A0A1S3IW47_LINAN|nr:uncharacterized protein LOC106168034 [Lingula anatina]|eukprot:XP_013402412.1 uncharacterized protein LOC106168034 [Lingula anatina]
MKAVILAAGYGTRLERDLRDDRSGQYSHLIGVPKPLLPIGHCPLISHWTKVLTTLPSLDGVYVVTNGANHEKFVTWAKDWSCVQLVCDGSMSNEGRTGAVGCLELCVRQYNVQDDLLVIAGDTLFFDDFDLSQLVQKFESFKTKDPDASMLVYVTCTDEEVHKYGILELNEEKKVVGFLEKPQPEETSSRKECPCFYFLSSKCLPLLSQFLEEKKVSMCDFFRLVSNLPLKARDATGNFIAYLYQRAPVYATEISGRFDVGGLQSYVICHEHFKKKAETEFLG